MSADSRRWILPAMVLAGLALAGCASSSPDFSSQHRGKWRVGQPNYTVAPYQVNGVWYYPKVDYNYSDTGTASWYGEPFHGRPTSDGEIYDMNQLTAAHKTLPLPSVVRVTNLQNGRELRLRVNDRGPFVGDRLIDVSRRAAQLLGFEGAGTTQVRVSIMREESLQVAEAAMRGESGNVALAAAVAPAVVSEPAVARAPPTQVAMAGPASMRANEVFPGPLPAEAPAAEPPPSVLTEQEPRYRPMIAAPPPVAAPMPRYYQPVTTAPVLHQRPAPAATSQRDWPALISSAHAEPLHLPPAKPIPVAAHGPTRIFIQAGAFAVPENAQRVRARIAALGPVEIVPGGSLYRVRLGPVTSEAAATRLLSKVVESGYPEARIIGE